MIVVTGSNGVCCLIWNKYFDVVKEDLVCCRLFIQPDMDDQFKGRSRIAIPRFVAGDIRKSCTRVDEGNTDVQQHHVQGLF